VRLQWGKAKTKIVVVGIGKPEMLACRIAPWSAPPRQGHFAEPEPTLFLST